MRNKHLRLVTEFGDPNKHKSLYLYYDEIVEDLNGIINPVMKTYLEPLKWLDQTTDTYGCDSGHYCVIYFLANTDGWKGESARRIKKELKDLYNNKKYQRQSRD